MFHFDSNIYVAKHNTMSEISVASDFDKVAETGGRLNKKDGLTRYGDSHVKDKTS